MILLDSDVLLIDVRYQRDPRYALNRQALQRLAAASTPRGITTQALLETVGILSFNLASASTPKLMNLLPLQYGLSVLPDPQQMTDYAGCTVNELLTEISRP